jgi:hypothetical protein
MVVSPVSGLALMIADALLEEISPAKSQLLLEDGFVLRIARSILIAKHVSRYVADEMTMSRFEADSIEQSRCWEPRRWLERLRP